jgi:hypothetical protein
MSLESEVLPDWAEVREKNLRTFGQTKSAHAALSLTRWLMAVLGAVVDSDAGFDEHVLTCASSARSTAVDG